MSASNTYLHLHVLRTPICIYLPFMGYPIGGDLQWSHIAGTPDVNVAQVLHFIWPLLFKIHINKMNFKSDHGRSTRLSLLTLYEIVCVCCTVREGVNRYKVINLNSSRVLSLHANRREWIEALLWLRLPLCTIPILCTWIYRFWVC